jgi:hypothetical protein
MVLSRKDLGWNRDLGVISIKIEMGSQKEWSRKQKEEKSVMILWVTLCSTFIPTWEILHFFSTMNCFSQFLVFLPVNHWVGWFV